MYSLFKGYISKSRKKRSQHLLNYLFYLLYLSTTFGSSFYILDVYLFYENSSVEKPSKEQVKNLVVNFGENAIDSLIQEVSNISPGTTILVDLTTVLNTIQFESKFFFIIYY
jgi:hypothetical protein